VAVLIKGKKSYSVLRGLSRRLLFSLPNASVDPTGALSAIELPVTADLLAALLLERFGQQMRKRGFPFGSAETGHGRYTASTSETPEMSIGVILARIDEEPSDPSHYELGVSCQRPVPSQLFKRVRSTSPSDQDYLAWETLQNAIVDALREEFGTVDLS
jgi:hypothetical protein